MGNRLMAYEYNTPHGTLRLVKGRRHWAIEFDGRRAGVHPSAEIAVAAAARHASGLSGWDRLRSVEVSPDILDWRPLGDSI